VAGGALICALTAVALLTPVNPGPADDSVLSPGAASLRASIDPETGELVTGHTSPDQDPDLAMQRALDRSTEGLAPVQHPDGAVSVDLQGRFRSATVARINDDGQLETTCVDGQAQADAFFAGDASTTKPEVQ